MKRKAIESREDIALLVHTFYGKVRAHEALGPVFNGAIKDWPEHLDKLTDFWETSLLYVMSYKGNPLKAHLSVDRQFNNSIEQAHFDSWLKLWFETLDELFIDKNADMAKGRANAMAHTIFLRIFKAREHQGSNG